MISGPSDFSHITHMGPGEGIEFQHLIDVSKTHQSHVQKSTVAQNIIGGGGNSGGGPVLRSCSVGGNQGTGLAIAAAIGGAPAEPAPLPLLKKAPIAVAIKSNTTKFTYIV